MANKSYNFTIEKGATKVITLKYTDAAGNVIDLSDYEARMQFREQPNSDIVSLSIDSLSQTPLNSLLTIDKPAGSIQIYISAQESSGFTKDVYFYDLEIFTDQDPFNVGDTEFVKRLVEGTVKVKFNITR